MVYIRKLCKFFIGLTIAVGFFTFLAKTDIQNYISSSVMRVGSMVPDTSLTNRRLVVAKMPLESTNDRRKRIINEVCKANEDLYLGSTTDAQVQTNLHLDRNHNIFYCQIQKVGSTFMRKLLATIHTKSNVTKSKPPLTRLSSIKNFRFAELYSAILKSFKFLFVREPYGRALSGYIDKLFAPNPMYWKSIGVFAIKEFREDAPKTNPRCGHDLTFPEFVKYLIYSQDTNTHKDRHFYPMYEHCLPCEIKYDFIGKLETFMNDTLYLIDYWNKAFGTNIAFEDFEKESDIQFAKSQVQRLYAFRTNVEMCMTFHKGMQRVWRLLQARGVISKKDEMPVSEKESLHMNQTDYTKIINNAIESITDRKAVKAQRKEVIVEAYRQVPIEDLQILCDMFRPDFELFDYDPLPNYIFERGNVRKKNDEFSFFDVL